MIDDTLQNGCIVNVNRVSLISTAAGLPSPPSALAFLDEQSDYGPSNQHFFGAKQHKLHRSIMGAVMGIYFVITNLA
ncbi:MAG: hypothetical protein ACTIDY_08070 [Halomonadaceae bacterium]|uniref:Uncharacterized protein n=1 Tax=Halomonas colorata TaxID=2742615 RepID=A0ABR9G0A7_9GAMM|nr:hypothetical protein [Halomonas colorata]MBE0464337.1 hypothetical protein [Halomonas colorata]